MVASRRLPLAVALVVLWTVITVLGGRAQAGQGSLATLVSQQIVWATPAAALFLLVSARLLGWRDIGLNAPRPPASITLFWLLGIYLLLLGGLAIGTSEISRTMLLLIAVNTAFVGFSEELAFRGVLWGAARRTMSFWSGVIFVSSMFGGVHIFNALITGEVGEAGIQALNAFLSGIAYLALRIRTRSLYPIMIAHWLWDLTIVLVASGGGDASSREPAERLLFGLALVAPLAIYGLWLLRRREFQTVTDDPPSASSGRPTINHPREALS